ncbi:MAG: hypothetical protein H3C38_04265 [Rhodospirillales bacterium]|nr:hypothetical protein [Rhodospirillales bacterium]
MALQEIVNVGFAEAVGAGAIPHMGNQAGLRHLPDPLIAAPKPMRDFLGG